MISYLSSIVTMNLSCTVSEILNRAHMTSYSTFNKNDAPILHCFRVIIAYFPKIEDVTHLCKGGIVIPMLKHLMANQSLDLAISEIF